MTLLGTNLTGGRSRSLALKNPIWSNLPAPAGPITQAAIDVTLNPGWGVDFQTDRSAVKLAPKRRHVKPDGTAVDLPVLPGFYTALERSIVDGQIVNNELKQIAASSNEVSFAVSPRIVSHDPPDAAGDVQINLGPEFDPLDANLDAEAIQVIVDGDVYARVNTDPPGHAGEFFVTNTPSNLIRIRPRFPAAGPEAEAHACRVVVNGAESPPFWIELP
jgi:hypothetical protein